MKTNTSDEVDECLLYIESSPPSQLVKSTGSHSMTYYRNRELPISKRERPYGRPWADKPPCRNNTTAENVHRTTSQRVCGAVTVPHVPCTHNNSLRIFIEDRTTETHVQGVKRLIMGSKLCRYSECTQYQGTERHRVHANA
jgi:hypothetical protein